MFGKTKERLTAIETEQNGIKGSIDEIRTNHLPHIETAIDKNANKVDRLKTWIMGALLMSALTLIGIICNILR